jgi:hypothetical protein
VTRSVIVVSSGLVTVDYYYYYYYYYVSAHCWSAHCGPWECSSRYHVSRGWVSRCPPQHPLAARRAEPLTCADSLSGHGSATGQRYTTRRRHSSTATGKHVIDLDPRWRVVIVLAAFAVIPLLLTLS